VADVQAWPEVLQSVTPEDVMAAAATVLDRKSAVTGWLMREGGAGTMIRFVLIPGLLLLALPARAERRHPEITSPGGITAWLVEDTHPLHRAGNPLSRRHQPGCPGKRGAVNLMTALIEEGAGDWTRRALPPRAMAGGAISV
jgi:hypothetical protein